MNNKMIQINILAHNLDRFEFFSRSLEELKKIKNKELIKIVVALTSESNLWEIKMHEFKELGFDFNLIYNQGVDSSGLNYMNKIYSLINSDCEYSCSIDDDILISSYLWDYIIENINVLDNEENLLITPLISNGIPTVDFFVEDFYTLEEREVIHNIFKTTYIDNYWGVNYSSLNYKKSEWNMDFYSKVKEINHYYKGIHPVRISEEAHQNIAENICNKREFFMSKQDYRLEFHKLPYFCNSFFFIKTSVWKKIIEDQSLFRDPFDEVPLNLYMEKNNLNMVIVRNGFCIHMAYNTITNEKQKKIENFYLTNFIHHI
jgi:hypothetical protein